MIKCDSKDNFNVTKDFYFNKCSLEFSKNACFYKNMKQHNCFNIDNLKSIKGFLSTGSAVVTAAEKPAFPLQKK